MTSQYIEIPSQEIEIEIDLDDVIDNGKDEIYNIAEKAIEDFDFDEKFRSYLDGEFSAHLDDHLADQLSMNPKMVLDAIVKAIHWASERGALVSDQRGMIEKQRQENVQLKRKLEDFLPPLKETKGMAKRAVLQAKEEQA